MKKKVLVGMVGTMLVSSIGFAAPVVDVAKGDTVLDVSYNKLEVEDTGVKFGTYESALTYGLTDKWALTVGRTWTENKTIFEESGSEDEYYYWTESAKIKANINDVKLQYKATKELAPFVGYKKWEVKGTYTYSEYGGETNYTESESDSYDKSGVQFGFIYNTDISDKANAYATAAFGKDIKEYKLGLAYDIAKNTTLDVNYKKIAFDVEDVDIDAKGVGLGLTYKF